MFDIAVIPAAGRGVRLDPYTENTPKVLFEIGGVSLIERNLRILKEKVKVKKVYIILGHLGDGIKEQCGNGEKYGLKIEYIICTEVQKGLAHGLLLLKDKITQPFVVLLGDELYLKSNHEKLLSFDNTPFDAVCGFRLTGDLSQIKQNYSLTIENNKIISLTEKPEESNNNNLGCGTFIFTPAIFSHIETTPISEKSHRVELIDTINHIAQKGGNVLPLQLEGEYKNINFSKDYIAATYLHRKYHFQEYKTSLVIPAYNEEISIGFVIDEFKGLVDEIIVAASFSDDKTVEIARQKADLVIVDNFKGYGDALRAGMAATTGDIIILVEADASFTPDDLPKFFSYLRDADMVIGTRTTKQMIQQGANMDLVIRVGNALAAKVLQVLWLSQEPRFTDLGCTYRAIWRDCYNVIKKDLTADGPEFSPEMMVEVMKAKRMVIEIPVTYRPRIGGESKHSHNKLSIMKTGIKMLTLILRKFIRQFI